MKKPPKFDEKTKRKTRGSIDKKPPKLDQEMRKKTNHSLFYTLLYRSEKPLKLCWENGEENLILIKDRNWELWIKGLSMISKKGMLLKALA